MNHKHTTKPGRPALRILFPEDLEATFIDLLQGGELKTAAVNLGLDWERITREAKTVSGEVVGGARAETT